MNREQRLATIKERYRQNFVTDNQLEKYRVLLDMTEEEYLEIRRIKYPAVVVEAIEPTMEQ